MTKRTCMQATPQNQIMMYTTAFVMCVRDCLLQSAAH